MNTAGDTLQSLPDDVEGLRALVLTLVAERDAAMGERDAVISERDALQEQNDRIRHLLLKLKRMQFGAKSERLPEEQLQLGLEALVGGQADSEAFEGSVAALRSLAAELGRDLNRLAWEIRPTALDDLGIQTAIRNLMEAWSERSAIPFDLHISLNDERLPSEIGTTLYRVLQEALTNVVRHANATRVGVVLGATERLISLIIEDDGQGFLSDTVDLGNLPPKRLGLLGIRERVALVEGSLEVESSPGKGTTVFVRIPLGVS